MPSTPSSLFVTGYADKNALRDVGEESIIKKPFIGEELAKKVNAALVKEQEGRGAAQALTILGDWPARWS
jgi:DNA-binding response OmpR family regulator